MDVTRTLPTPPTTARRLADDHHTFERTFDELLARARGGDWHDLDEVWDRFVDDIEDHFAFEETVVFPPFAELGRRERAMADRLVREHAEIRRLLDDLGVQIQIHQIRASTVAAFCEQLREHACRENLEIYPWVEGGRRVHSTTPDTGIAMPASSSVAARIARTPCPAPSMRATTWDPRG